MASYDWDGVLWSVLYACICSTDLPVMVFFLLVLLVTVFAESAVRLSHLVFRLLNSHWLVILGALL